MPAACYLVQKGKWMSIAGSFDQAIAVPHLEVRQSPLDPLRLIPILHRRQPRIDSSEVVHYRRAFKRERREGDGRVRLERKRRGEGEVVGDARADLAVNID